MLSCLAQELTLAATFSLWKVSKPRMRQDLTLQGPEGSFSRAEKLAMPTPSDRISISSHKLSLDTSIKKSEVKMVQTNFRVIVGTKRVFKFDSQEKKVHL